ncbi:Kunitz/Bovine pancreatic trypsin inhibitor domain protein [Teladorsagia circumcincta]|uniref:Kunitz/Bovine pancreatic trypsin inhibitor domain protein n=1 Tax=Teladorsagia circumcincta TaxID=45464 RepID=A0A2G9UGX2_TELCI|nr:Kunitz/Bovine pancreatic trypsin inhibitor domain protein [Teladorsagia circumcincta]
MPSTDVKLWQKPEAATNADLTAIETVFVKEECKRKDIGILSADICDLELVTGPCRARIPKFGFNKTAGECQEFVYGGCRGNANRFDSFDECKRLCPSKK